MFKIVKQIESVDAVVKYVLSDDEYGLTEVSVLRKSNKDVIVVPSQTNCRMGCVFCHLTGTDREVRGFDGAWFLNVFRFMVRAERLGMRPLLVSFMGAGEPLLNVAGVIAGMRHIQIERGDVRFGVATMMPSLGLMSVLEIAAVVHKLNVKVHLSVHGIGSRGSVIKSGVDVLEAIDQVRRYGRNTGNGIEYHYTLVRGVNDVLDELKAFRDAVGDEGTVKFLKLSECGGCQESLVSQEQILEIFSGVTVEFYDPPGRDVGSSCGMFDRTIYMKEPR